MTGAAGFAKQGQDSFRENRSLRNRRPSLKDNPYAASKSEEGMRNAESALEVQQWKELKSRQAKRLRLFIFALIIPGLALFALLMALLH